MSNTKPPLISVDELKLLVHKESGYRIQISDDDPLLTTIYINLAVLGSALKKAGELQNSAAEIIGGLPGAADKEMKRAGDQAILALSGEVGKIAQRIAGDAADTERYYARNKAVGFVGAVVLLTALLFGGGGYLYAASMTASHLNAAERDLAQANLLLENANKRVDEKIVELEKNSAEEIAKIRAVNGWAGTLEGKLAKDFFTNFGGSAAVNCKGETWKIETIGKVKYCVPERRGFFEISADTAARSGWKIP